MPFHFSVSSVRERREKEREKERKKERKERDIYRWIDREKGRDREVYVHMYT
jgi:hypothetical protein